MLAHWLYLTSQTAGKGPEPPFQLMEQEEGQWKNLNNTHLPELTFPDRLYILYTIKIIHKGQQCFSLDHRLDRKDCCSCNLTSPIGQQS